ncbi:glycoside hydrolase family 78 protein [Neolentinus lepideus HHB14362 ss-1]|uniref:Glycoside hydrolase family 78 protein n=1 Tax=Neolentinus lepideus HHB14362 ss-1 TaxID=1314782 RepID=A0A165SDN4_9AGAM|nr:glycoside hydrolase family 78 protein [Neolentinus lepideus HHB14362 ss-1]
MFGTLIFVLFTISTWASAPSGPWDAFNYAPKSTVVWPTAVYHVEGAVDGANSLVENRGAATLAGSGAWLALDFGVEVGGLISMNFLNPSSTVSIALSFTESPLFISPLTSDDSSYPASNMSYDGVLNVPSPLPSGFWTQPSFALRGGFRYLTIVSNSNEPLTISNVSCAILFMPHVDNLGNYAGYFYAEDPVFHDADFLTKLWYSGAYTVQTNTVPLDTGREVPFVTSPGWENNATLGVAGPIIVDGAKRDRAVWPGDMGIAVPTQFVSTNDLLPTKNALSTMFAAIDPITGALPESGPPLSQTGSDTYHAWTLIGTHNYYLYSGDMMWLQTVWTNYTKAVQFLENKVDSSGLMNVTGLRDWARLGGGGHNSEGNALLYKVLTNSVDLATYMNASDLVSAWARNASSLKQVFNQAFWDPNQEMYRDNTSTTLCPQDANSMSVIFNLTTSPGQADAISAGLQRNWNDLGPVAPELPDTISPFISGLELQAHFQSGNDDRAMDLLHREWGYMLYTNLSVQSTLLEGFTANGSLYYRGYRGYNYDASYTSHSHGWSSGPTSALTYYVLGLTVTSPQGKTWSVAPHLSGLNAAEGGFTTPLGWYGVKWRDEGNVFMLDVNVPTGTSGVVRLPYAEGKVEINGFSAGSIGDVINLNGGHKTTITLYR